MRGSPLAQRSARSRQSEAYTNRTRKQEDSARGAGSSVGDFPACAEEVWTAHRSAHRQWQELKAVLVLSDQVRLRPTTPRPTWSLAMKAAGGMRFCGLVLLTTLATVAVLHAEEPVASSPPVQPPAITPQQIEADWLLQDVVRKLPPADPTTAQRTPVTTADDAAGAVDGIKDGTYGFHTAGDATPWWQVDLGQSLPLGRIVLYNRCDGKVEDRAARVAVLLSDDGKAWQPLYQHDGTKFFGQTGGPPLTVDAGGKPARFVRLQQPAGQYFHLDEVEVYRADGNDNVALHRPADQSSVSQWSKPHTPLVAAAAAPTPAAQEPAYPVEEVLKRGAALAADLRRLGTDVAPQEQILREVEQQFRDLGQDAPAVQRRELYLKARWAVRRMTLANPLLDFDDLLFVKRVPGSFTHMSDQYYGWFSRPGGGVFVMEDFKSDQPHLRCLTAAFPPGTFLRPDLSHDGTRVLFGYCKYYPSLKGEPNKLDKNNVPEDAFFHLYEMNLDGSGVRRLTHGKYDDFDGRYLPNGEVVFLSTRRGQYIQCGSESGHASRDGALPDCYVRCGGGPERPVAVYTLHVMTAERREHPADFTVRNVRVDAQHRPGRPDLVRPLGLRRSLQHAVHEPVVHLAGRLQRPGHLRELHRESALRVRSPADSRFAKDDLHRVRASCVHRRLPGAAGRPSCGGRRSGHDAADAGSLFPRIGRLAADVFRQSVPVVREPLPDRVERATAAARYAASRLGHARAGQRPGLVPVRRLRQLEFDLPRSGDRQRDAVADPAARP